MKWSNLKNNKCPKCNKDWLRMGNAIFAEHFITCKCGFKISEKRMTEIVSDKVNQEILENMEQEYEQHNARI